MQCWGRVAILFGKDAQKISSCLQQSLEVIHVTDSVEAVVLSLEKANTDDVVLFSPACASFDMFDNFEHRGEQFIQAVKELH